MKPSPTPANDPAMQGLAPADAERLYAAARAIRNRRPAAAATAIAEVLAQHPHHAEALRLRSIIELNARQPQRALDSLRVALAHAPRNAAVLAQIGSVYSACGQRDAAIGHWRRAVALDESLAPAWFNLGRAFSANGDSAAACSSFARVRALLPDFVPAAVLHGDSLSHTGHIDDAAQAYRAALATTPGCGDAWRGLSNLKTLPFRAEDAPAMHRQLARRDLADSDRVLINLALGRLEEERGHLPEALAAFNAGNRLQSRLTPWSRDAFETFVDSALARSETLPTPLDPNLGREVIFIVGMPRSGSTLCEQILAAHPMIAGASELSDLGIVIEEESRRRGKRFPDWAADADAGDWQRLGRDYLARTAHWRRERPRSTDKMPENWKFAGFLRAMLPGAHVIETRRDRLETAWSCYKQPFYVQPHFSNDFADLGVYIRGLERAIEHWRTRDPEHQHRLDLETLVAEPEPTIRRLLELCDLPFDPACLDFHRADRSVRTASAAQVREPLHAVAARAAAYGSALDPLRRALEPTPDAGDR